MRIGLDLHGVIDRFRPEFASATSRWLINGHEVHIVTGSQWESVQDQLGGISYTHHFSIVDHHIRMGTKMVLKDSGWWMDGETWDRSKGDYAKAVGLDIHFEDTMRYAQWFPPGCTFVHVGAKFRDSFPALRDFLSAFDLLNIRKT